MKESALGTTSRCRLLKSGGERFASTSMPPETCRFTGRKLTNSFKRRRLSHNPSKAQSMQAKLEQCRDILRSIPTEDGVRLEAMRVFQEVLTELQRIRPGIDRLSERELQVFEFIGCGLVSKEIATQIGIG